MVETPARQAFLAIRNAPESTEETVTLLRQLGAAFQAPYLDKAADRLAARPTGGAARAVRAAVLAELDDEMPRQRDARVSRGLLEEYDELIQKGISERKAIGVVARRHSRNPVEQANVMRRIRAHRAKRKTERLRP
jgi:hypothetical protein